MRAALFDHFVGEREQRMRDGNAEHPGGLGVDDELELARLHDRQVCGLGARQNATGIGANLTPSICNIGPVAHQPARFGEFACAKGRRDRVARCQIDQLETPAGEKGVARDEEGIGRRARKRRECCIDLVVGAGVENLELQPAGATAAKSFTVDLPVGYVGLASTATRAAAGTSSRRSSSRFVVNSADKKFVPVKLPLGRARLLTSPSFTGSSSTLKTMGTVVVAALAANAAAAPNAAIKATCRRSRSSASAGSRSL